MPVNPSGSSIDLTLDTRGVKGQLAQMERDVKASAKKQARIISEVQISVRPRGPRGQFGAASDFERFLARGFIAPDVSVGESAAASLARSARGGMGGGRGGGVGGEAAGLFDKSGAFGRVGTLLKGGGAAIGATLVANAIGHASSKAAELVKQFRAGELSSRQMGEELAGAIPIFGQAISGALEFGKAISASHQNLERVNRGLAEQHRAIGLLRDAQLELAETDTSPRGKLRAAMLRDEEESVAKITAMHAERDKLADPAARATAQKTIDALQQAAENRRANMQRDFEREIADNIRRRQEERDRREIEIIDRETQARKRAEEEVERARLDSLQRIAQRAEQLREEVATPTEKAAARFREIEDLRLRGAISKETARRQVRQLRDSLAPRDKGGFSSGSFGLAELHAQIQSRVTAGISPEERAARKLEEAADKQNAAARAWLAAAQAHRRGSRAGPRGDTASGLRAIEDAADAAAGMP